jgi:hypothetical protein
MRLRSGTEAGVAVGNSIALPALTAQAIALRVGLFRDQ